MGFAEAVMAQGIAKIFERFGDGMLVGGGRGRYEQGRVGGGAGVDLRREEGGGQSGAEKGGSRVRWVLGRGRGLRRGVQPEICFLIVALEGGSGKASSVEGSCKEEGY
jgi:hypothetical protein